MSTLQRFAVAGEPTLDNAWGALKRLENLLGRTPQWQAHRHVTAATTIVDSDVLVTVDTTSAGVTVTLPVASTVFGRQFTIKKTNAGANNITLDGNGSETIDGAATLVWNTQYLAYTVQASLTTAPATYNWYIVSKS